MGGWGNKDKKGANTGTVAITAVVAGGGGGVVTGTSTKFDDELKVGDYVHIVSEGFTYIVTSIASNTSAVFRAGEPGNPAIVAVTGANTYYISEKPKFASFGGAGAATAPSAAPRSSSKPTAAPRPLIWILNESRFCQANRQD